MSAVIATFGLIPGIFIIIGVYAACAKAGEAIDQAARKNANLQHISSVKNERLYRK